MADFEKASWYHNKGYEARKNNDFILAISLYTEGLKYNPKHFKMIYNRGFAYDKLKMYELAI